MDTNDKDIFYKELSYKIIGLAMEVHSELGFGYLEKVYENALILLLKREGLNAEQQASIKVYFKDVVVGQYYADILVEDMVVLELKVANQISDVDKAQALNYLKSTGLRLAIILNFGKTKLEYERLVN